MPSLKVLCQGYKIVGLLLWTCMVSGKQCRDGTGVTRLYFCRLLYFLLVAMVLPGTLFAQAAALSSASGSAPLPSGVEVVPSVGHSLGLAGVATSPDGRLIASAGFEDVKVWEAASGRLIRTFADGLQINSVIAFMPDGRRIVTGSEDFKVRLWDIETGKLLREFSGPTDLVFALAISPDGRRILSAGNDKAVRVWDADTGALVRVFEAHQKYLGRNSLATDGNSVVSADGDGKVLVWNLETGQIERTLDSPEQHWKAVAFSPNGRIILVSTSAGATVFDRQTGRVLRTLKGHEKTLVAWVGVAPDGKTAVTGGSDYSLCVWDLASGVRKFVIEGLELKSVIDGIAFVVESASNNLVAAAFISNTQLVTAGHGIGLGGPSLKIWNLTDGKRSGEIRGFGAPGAGFNSVVAGSGNSEVFLSSGAPNLLDKHGFIDKPESQISRLDLSTGRLSDFVARPYFVREHDLFFRDGFLYQAENDALIRINEMTKATDEVASLKADDNDLSNNVRTALVPHSALIAIVVDKDKIELRDPAVSDAPVRTFSGLDGISKSMAVSADGETLFVGTASGQILAWNLRDGRKILGWKAAGEEIANMAVSNDGLLAASSHFETGVFDRSARLLFVVKGHQRPITNLAFSSDGKHLMSAGADRIVNVWNAKTGELEHVLGGHSAFVTSVQGSADGRYIVSATEDKSVRIWEAATGRLLTTTYVFPDNEWVTMTPEGFFDCSSPAAAAKLTIVRGLEVYSIDQFREALYRPDLVKAKLALDNSDVAKASVANTNLTKVVESGNAPKVVITSPENGSAAASGEVNVEGTVTEQGGGIGRIEWRLNGQPVGIDTRGFQRVQDNAAAGATIKISQKMVLDAGDNVVEVVAYNTRGLVASQPARITIKATGPVAITKPRLFVLAVGVNDYYDGRLKLNFAVPDARSIAASFEKAGTGFYQSVKTVMVLDADVTRANLEKVFTQLASEVKTSDVFVFFIAGHGRTLDGHYYFLPQDFRYRDQSSFAENGLSQEQWQQWITLVQARKSVLIYDTCESGTVAGDNIVVASRGLQRVEEQAVAYEKLREATGRTILAASTDTQPALEGFHGHGLFSFVVMAQTNANGLIEVTGLISYVDDRVPDISYQVFHQHQIPQNKMLGSNFAIARPTATLLETAPAATAAPTTPTHVVVVPADVFERFGGQGTKLLQLPAGTLLSLVKTEQGWMLVARDGKSIGYVAADRLLRIQ
jgi:WD40 repeat protein